MQNRPDVSLKTLEEIMKRGSSKRILSIAALLLLPALKPICAQDLTSSPAKENRESFVACSYIPYAGSAGRKDAISQLFSMSSASITWNDRTFIVGDKLIRTNVHWIRDHALTVKSMRYVKSDMTSLIDLILQEQTPEGFFYEIIAPETDIHAGDIVPENCRKLLPNTGYGLSRLEIEADIEYLMVEGAYNIWQATGDDQWLKNNLPKLEKGLEYIMTSPKRWDKKYNLAKRVYTIDTWDFTNRISTQDDRGILPTDPMGIFHGDNTGLYYAMTLVAKMNEYLGNSQAAEKWSVRAEELKKRINKYLWNGKFYKHYLMLDKVDLGANLAEQMSLSNSYNLNRLLMSPEQARALLQSYRLMREKFKGPFDDFRTLEPAFPIFKGIKAGRYTNGAIGFFVAGELAVAAFENGMEEYGFDILERASKKILSDGKISFLYNYDGNDIAGGPRSWVGAELMHGLVRGLSGVVDNKKLFEDVTISPRWVVSNEEKVRVFLKYEASGAYLDYAFNWDKNAGKIIFSLFSRHKKAKLRMLIPPGAERIKLSINGKDSPFEIEDAQGSKYLVADNFPSSSKAEITYATDVSVSPIISVKSQSAGIYITNKLDKAQKCTVSLSMSGLKSAVARTFTLQPYERRHVEMMALEKTEQDGKIPKITLERDGKIFAFPVKKVINFHAIEGFKKYGDDYLHIKSESGTY